VCVPSGTVHALLDGLLIAEIQQNSNTTYRVFDWNRKQDGESRPLHITQAMDVIDFGVVEPRLPTAVPLFDSGGVRRMLLCRNRYFTTERVELEAGAEFRGELDGRSLEIWGAIDGDVDVKGVGLKAVQFTLLPAALGPFRVTTDRGAACLRAYVEDL
jgi:mannose-6-phosphate isomerase